MPRQPAPTSTAFVEHPEYPRDHGITVRNNLQWLEAMVDELAHFAASARRLSHIASSLPHPDIFGIDSTGFYSACQALREASIELGSVANTRAVSKLHGVVADFTGELNRASSNIFLESKRKTGDRTGFYNGAPQSPALSPAPTSPTTPGQSRPKIDNIPRILMLLERADCNASNVLEEKLQEVLDAFQSFTAAANKAASTLVEEVSNINLTKAMDNFLAAGAGEQRTWSCLDCRIGYTPVTYNDIDNDDYVIHAYNRDTINPLSALAARESLSGSGLGNSYKARSPAFGLRGPRSPSSKTTTLLHAITQRQQRCLEDDWDDDHSHSD